MHHPLPEVPKAAPKQVGKESFFGLNIVFGVNVFFNVFSMALVCFFPAPDPDISVLTIQIMATIFSVLSFLVDFYLWRGYNWARWLSIISGGFALWMLISPGEYQSTLTQIENIYKKSSSVWWIGLSLWLLLPNVARHFKAPKSV